MSSEEKVFTEEQALEIVKTLLRQDPCSLLVQHRSTSVLKRRRRTMLCI